VPNVFSACCLFHNLILEKREVDVEKLMQVIQMEVGTQDFNDAMNGLNYKVMTMFTSKAKYF
jgi:hypothetical protein